MYLPFLLHSPIMRVILFPGTVSRLIHFFIKSTIQYTRDSPVSFPRHFPHHAYYVIPRHRLRLGTYQPHHPSPETLQSHFRKLPQLPMARSRWPLLMTVPNNCSIHWNTACFLVLLERVKVIQDIEDVAVKFRRVRPRTLQKTLRVAAVFLVFSVIIVPPIISLFLLTLAIERQRISWSTFSILHRPLPQRY